MSALRNLRMLHLCRATRIQALSSPNCLQRRWNSNVSPSLTETNAPPQKEEIVVQRFWKDVGIEKRGNDFTITLDKRALKTPGGTPLLLPSDKHLVAAVIASEWDNQERIVKHHALPMTSLVSKAIDNLAHDATRQLAEEHLIRFLDTDTICFFHDELEPLERLQRKYWVPLLDWAREAFGVEIKVSTTVLSVKQPEETHRKIAEYMRTLDRWELAALERAAVASKSLIVALALVKRHLTAEEAALVASVEVDSQIERWGEVEDTHDVDYQDVRRQLASAALILTKQP